MKYSDFITLQDYFHPVFNLQNEASAAIGKNFYPDKPIQYGKFNQHIRKKYQKQ
jgi:hypothetical protein